MKKIECNCHYCNKYKNTFLWYVPLYNSVWIEIPKNASSSIKAQIRENQKRYEFPQLRIKAEEVKNYNSAFAIIREPIGRFKSLLHHFFIGGYRTNYGKEWLKKFEIEEYNENNICEIVLEYFDQIDEIYAAHHFRAQAHFIPKEFFEINYKIYDLKNLKDNIGLEHEINQSDKLTCEKIAINDSCLKLIKELYFEDFELYNKYIKNEKINIT